MKSRIQWCKIKPEGEESEESKLLNNILSGERQFWIELDRSIPSYASIDLRKVKVFHLGQKRTCARCQMDGDHCPGRANARQCEDNGGAKNDVEIAWKTVLNNVGYVEWTGAEVSKEASTHENHTEEEVEEDDVAPIEGCTGIVMDNLDENMTVEDIKTILKKGCSEETLNPCCIHPTGSLRSKIVEFH